MKDRLEEFLSDNRQEFYQDEAPSHLWQGIDFRLGRNSRWKRTVKLLQRAAVIALLVSTGFFISEYIHNHQVNRPVISAGQDIKLPTEVQETELYYTSLLNKKMEELQPVFTTYPELKQEISKDFSELDSICIQLKRDLKDNVSNQEVIEAMIQNYRTKVYILENLLTELQKNHEIKHSQNEKSSI
jgi:hypothetical protein